MKIVFSLIFIYLAFLQIFKMMPRGDVKPEESPDAAEEENPDAADFALFIELLVTICKVDHRDYLVISKLVTLHTQNGEAYF